MTKPFTAICKFAFTLLILLFIFFSFVFIHRENLKNSSPCNTTEEEKQIAKNNFYKINNFTVEHIHLNSIENFLPVKNFLNLNAESYILVDALTGTIILEHNADKIIPPASLTKLAAIYALMKNNNFQNCNKQIKPPKQSWAKFLPPNSAALGLDETQEVTIEDLLLGMSVCSGNDAALAAAIIAEGSSERFIKKLNTEMNNLGLKETCFVEPTGLSEKNKTTAKEFAAFSIRYIKEYPENLKKLHSVQFINYSSKTKSATNTLLQKLPGCDGLKTGFIYESGFNIALTAERNGTRFTAVILGGSGNSIKEGNTIREQNGIKIMNFAFDNFETISIQKENVIQKKIIVLGSNLKPKTSAIIPITACTDFSENHITLPKNKKITLQKITYLPDRLNAPLYAGQKVGQIEYKIKDSNIVLKTIPLICPVNIKEGTHLRKLLDGK